jgi:formylglycine-generating enzyme required for sulfatase activity
MKNYLKEKNMKTILILLCIICGLCINSIVLGVCPSADLNDDCKIDFKDFAILASQWLEDGNIISMDMTWIDIIDVGFTGKMAKFETTNTQYCLFLNNAISSGDVYVDGNYVKGSNSGNIYYYLEGPGGLYNGASNGGASRINYAENAFTVDTGFENHPVTYVSWYGATAFADYYGWQLPTEWQWQAVADYDGSYSYGCGVNIDNSRANYFDSVHPTGTTEVGAFGTYGYGVCDMSGNVWEWTNSIYTGTYRTQRGGGWGNKEAQENVTFRGYSNPFSVDIYTGFRVCDVE